MSQRINYKIILLGNSNTGKTSLLRRLSTSDFFEKNLSIIGVDKISICVDIINNKGETKIIDVSLFDTAGQEKFRSITISYYKGAQGALLIYDISNRLTFENIEIWIDSLVEALGTIKDSNFAVILIGNNSNLIVNNGLERQVTEEEAKKVCEKFNFIWGGEIDIKNIPLDALKKLFQSYVKQIYDKVGEIIIEKENFKKIKEHKKKKKNC